MYVKSLKKNNNVFRLNRLMLNIVLFGPPGSGKGTQSEKIINSRKLTHISTGDLFRKHTSKNTELGSKAKHFMDLGALVPDEVVIGMVEYEISKNKNANGFIFDGFPRTVLQAKELDKILAHHNMSVSMMIALEVPENELKKRIKERALTSGRLDDQDENKINNRIKVYHEETVPVLNYYMHQKKRHLVKGTGTVESIENRIGQAIDSVVDLSS